jgi:hypothetical protein
MTSLDPWFMLMVGQWWTPESDLGIVGAAATKRQATATAYQNFSDQLRQALNGPLSPEVQKGQAADGIREVFNQGVNQSSEVSKTNGVISDAHQSAGHQVSHLNSRLQSIAEQGKSDINRIMQSKDPLPMKMSEIVDVVVQCQQDANSAAAPTTQNVFEAMQKILDQRGIRESARQFAQQHGIDTTRMLGSPNKEAVGQQVKGLFEQSGPPKPPDSEQSDPFGSAQNDPGQLPPQTTGTGSILPAGNVANNPSGPASATQPNGSLLPAGGVLNSPASQLPGTGSSIRGPGSIGALPGSNASVPSAALNSISPSSPISQ